jgi:hypothetical protein
MNHKGTEGTEDERKREVRRRKQEEGSPKRE